MGGSIGQGLPLATGAATACPDRKVICLEGDGSAMYTIQSLWTQAREGLDVTNIVFANRRYAILEVELARVGAQPGPQAQRNYSIGDPDLDFVALARGLGVPAARVTTADEFNARFAAAMAEPGPSSDRNSGPSPLYRGVEADGASPSKLSQRNARKGASVATGAGFP